MKRLFSLLFAAALVFSLAGCGSAAESDPPDPPPDAGDPPDSAGEVPLGQLPDDAALPEPSYVLNPLTGENTLLESRANDRPVAVSVSNYRYARPHFGIAEADCIIESEALPGETRLLCWFSGPSAVPKTGPVASLPDHFMEIGYPLDATFLYYGLFSGSDFFGTHSVRALDGEADPDLISVDTARHDDPVKSYLIEYCRFTGAAEIESGLAAAGFAAAGTPAAPLFDFADASSEPAVPASGDALQVSVTFSSFYDCDLRFDASSGRYQKWQFWQPQTDEGNGEQLSFTNALLLFADCRIPDNPAEPVSFSLSGGGTGYYLSGGRYEEIRWEKSDDDGIFHFFGAGGDLLRINTGKTYLAVFDADCLPTLRITA